MGGEPEAEDSSLDLSSLTIAQLKAYAAEKGIVITATKKADIISQIETAQK